MALSLEDCSSAGRLFIPRGRDMRYTKTMTVVATAVILGLWVTGAAAQVYAGESEPGWIVGYDGALGTVVNPGTQIPGVLGA